MEIKPPLYWVNSTFVIILLNLTLHYTRAHIELKPINTFFTYKDVVCLAILPINETLATFGQQCSSKFSCGILYRGYESLF